MHKRNIKTTITVHLTKEEKSEIIMAAKEQGKTTGGYLLELYNKEVEDKKDFDLDDNVDNSIKE